MKETPRQPAFGWKLLWTTLSALVATFFGVFAAFALQEYQRVGVKNSIQNENSLKSCLKIANVSFSGGCMFSLLTFFLGLIIKYASRHS